MMAHHFGKSGLVLALSISLAFAGLVTAQDAESPLSEVDPGATAEERLPDEHGDLGMPDDETGFDTNGFGDDSSADDEANGALGADEEDDFLQGDDEGALADDDVDDLDHDVRVRTEREVDVRHDADLDFDGDELHDALLVGALLDETRLFHEPALGSTGFFLERPVTLQEQAPIVTNRQFVGGLDDTVVIEETRLRSVTLHEFAPAIAHEITLRTGASVHAEDVLEADLTRHRGHAGVEDVLERAALRAAVFNEPLMHEHAVRSDVVTALGTGETVVLERDIVGFVDADTIVFEERVWRVVDRDAFLDFVNTVSASERFDETLAHEGFRDDGGTSGLATVT